MARHPLFGNPDVYEVRVPVTTMWADPGAPRDVDAPATRDDPDMAEWVGGMDAQTLDTQTRKGLHGRSLTQLLLGEAVQVVEARDDWVRVVALIQPSSQHEHGYPGWVPRAHLGTPVPRDGGPSAFVVTPSAVCTLEDGTSTRLSFGTAVWVDSVSENAIVVALPGDRRGTLCVTDLRLSRKSQQPTYTPVDLLASARQFLGVRYLWGGTSAWGLDCSGLVHLVYRAHGRLVPRDAFDQVEQVTPVPLDAVRPGDLYFFARPGERIYHVGFATAPPAPDGTRTMLHAPESGELIEDAPLAAHRVETLVGAGRVGGE